MKPIDITQLTGSLKDLQDIIVPDAVGIFPPAPAWIALGFFLGFLVVRLMWRQAAAYLDNRYRRQAIARVVMVEKKLFSSGQMHNTSRLVSSLPALLKQTAILAFGRETVAGLCQDDWITFLNASAPGVIFSPEMAQVLTTSAYGSASQINDLPRVSLDQILYLVKKWIKTHKKEFNQRP